MYTSNTRATTNKWQKKNYNWYANEERKWTHIKHSIKTTKGRKRVEDKKDKTRAINRKQ